MKNESRSTISKAIFYDLCYSYAVNGGGCGGNVRGISNGRSILCRGYTLSVV